MTERCQISSRDVFKRLSHGYKLQYLTAQTLPIRSSVLGLVSDVEQEFAREDGRLEMSPYRDCVRTTLVNMETIASAIDDDANASLSDLFIADIEAKYGGARLANPDWATGVGQMLRYRALILRHTAPVSMKSYEFDRSSFFELHASIAYPNPDYFEPLFRGQGCSDPWNLHEGFLSKMVVVPAQIGTYLDDLFAFCNSRVYSPLVQRTAAFLQLFVLCPFKTRPEMLAKLLAYSIDAKRGLSNNAIAPISLSSLYNWESYMDSIESVPGEGGIARGEHGRKALEFAIIIGINSLKEGIRLVRLLKRRFQCIESDWRSRLPGIRLGDTRDRLIRALLSTPVINTAAAMGITNKTYTAVNDALSSFVEVGILAPVPAKKRNRIFVARDVVDIYNAVFAPLMPSSIYAE